MHLDKKALSTCLIALCSATSLWAQTDQTECSTSNLVPTSLLLTWPDVPTEDTVAVLPTTEATLSIVNQGEATIDFELVGHIVAGGQRLDLALASGTLATGGTQSVGIALDSFGIDIASLAFSGSLFIEARGYAGGELVDRAYSPVVFFHQEASPFGTPQNYLYGREGRKLSFHSGDLLYQIFPSSVPDTVLGIFDAGAGAQSEDTGPTLPPTTGV